MKTIVSTPDAPAAIGPYSQGVIANGLLFTSGQIPLDPQTGAVVSGGIDEQTIRTLDNLEAVIRAAGLSLADVVQTNIYVTSLAHFARVNELYAARFGSGPYPARITVEVPALPKGVLIEISAVAAAGAGK